MDPGSKTDSTNKTKITFVDLHYLRGGECTRTTNSDGKVQTFFFNFFCSIDFLLRKVKKHPCQWYITSPVLDPHLCPGPFSMARATRAARHGPESPRSTWRRGLLWQEVRKWPLGCFPGETSGGPVLWASQDTAGGTPAGPAPGAASHYWSSWAAELSLAGPRQPQRDDWIVWGDAQQPGIKRAQNWLKSILLPHAATCELYVLHLRNCKFKVSVWAVFS